MKTIDFNDIIIKERIGKIRDILIQKGNEYDTEEERFHSFNTAAKKYNKTPERIAHEWWTKHYVSFLDMLDALEDKGPLRNRITSKLIDDKIGDMINYLILIEGMLKERIEARFDKRINAETLKEGDFIPGGIYGKNFPIIVPGIYYSITFDKLFIFLDSAVAGPSGKRVGRIDFLGEKAFAIADFSVLLKEIQIRRKKLNGETRIYNQFTYYKGQESEMLSFNPHERSSADSKWNLIQFDAHRQYIIEKESGKILDVSLTNFKPILDTIQTMLDTQNKS